MVKFFPHDLRLNFDIFCDLCFDFELIYLGLFGSILKTTLRTLTFTAKMQWFDPFNFIFNPR